MKKGASAPRSDEIEVSLFGPGYGEAVLIHLGFGEWVVIDSCIDTQSGAAVPIDYLESIGVDIASQVKTIIVTHWHDDHIRGIGKLVHKATSAKVCFSAAFKKTEFISFAIANQSVDPSPLARATKEIVSVLRMVRGRGMEPKYVGPDRLLYAGLTHGASGCSRIFSLSPSDKRIGEFLSNVAMQMASAGEPRRRASDLAPNALSVALLVEVPNGALLLGGDLEETPGRGWTTILAHSEVATVRANVFKVPHHGSETGECGEVWETLLDSQVIAVLAPWTKGSKHVPTETDVARILARTPRAYSTARPGSVSPIRRQHAVSRGLQDAGIKVTLAQPRRGHVRLRRLAHEVDWNVQLDGTARHLEAIFS